MNDIYFDERVKHNRIGNLGFELVNMQRKLVCWEYEIEKLRIKAAMYRAFFFHNFDLAERLRDQNEKNDNALIGEFDGFCYASWRRDAIFRSLEDMCVDGLLTEEEYRECMNA